MVRGFVWSFRSAAECWPPRPPPVRNVSVGVFRNQQYIRALAKTPRLAAQPSVAGRGKTPAPDAPSLAKARVRSRLGKLLKTRRHRSEPRPLVRVKERFP